MRIAIDARELDGQMTGVGRYLLQVLREWRHLPEAAGHAFVVCSPAPLHIDLQPLDVAFMTAPGSGARWTQLTLPSLVRRSAADVLFAPAYEAPLLCRVPTVLSVHDVSFFAHPEWFGPRERLRRQLLTRISARRASRVLTFSEFSKQEIVRYLNVPSAHVEVTYHGITRLSDPGDDRPDSTHPDDDGALVLFVGSIFNRRHVPELIEGFSRLASRHASTRLEIVGDNRTRPFQDLDAIAGKWPRARVRARSYVADAELAALYRHATAFVFLSDYEGFGMTPLEALAADVPIVVLDTPVSREVYGPAAVYIERPDPSLIASALERVLYDEQERSRLLDAARTLLERYSWRACAQQTLRALLTAHS